MSLRHALQAWPLIVNLALLAFIGGAFLAPILAAAGFDVAARGLYSVYHLTCHQWAFRSFFLFGKQAVYGQEQLDGMGVDPYGFTGNAEAGWKMACCERDLAIYIGLLVVGLLYARHRALPPLGFQAYTLLILPMALDGFTQLFGWRESTWELRVVTGLVFGLASAWLVLPRLDAAFGLPSATSPYAPDTTCEALSPLSPRG